MKPLPFLLIAILSACSLKEPRTSGTYISSTPNGANILIVHSEEFYDKIYQYPQKYNYEGKIVSIYGTTPLMVEVPKGSTTQIILEMNGYKPVEFDVNVKMTASYYNGKNQGCVMDKYWSWLWSFGILHKSIKFFAPSIYKNHCTQARHNYHIKLDEIQ